MSRRTQPPKWLYFAAVDRNTENGQQLSGLCVSGACLSERGALKHVRRLRRREPGAYVEGRRRYAQDRGVQSLPPCTAAFLDEMVTRPYAIDIHGAALAPDLPDGCRAIFDPRAGSSPAGEIVAIWLHDHDKPMVVRLGPAVPPEGKWLDLEPMVGFKHDCEHVRLLKMRNVRAMHRLARVALASDVSQAVQS